MAISAECPYCHKKQATKNKLCSCRADLDRFKRSKKVRYWIDYQLPGGKTRRESVGYSIEKARDAIGKRRAQKREGRIFDVKPDIKTTFNELTNWYLGLEKVKALSSCWRVKISLDKSNSVFGNCIIKNIKAADLENYQAKKKAEGKADKTIDHEIGAAQTVVSKAFDNDMVGGDILKTFKKVKKMLKRNSNARNRILSKDEFEDLLVNSPQHIKGIVATGYYTGMREGEILNLTWDKADLKNRLIQLEPEDTKDKEARAIPIIDDLHGILKSIPRAIHDPHVFLYKGRPIKSINRALRTACKGAGITWGRFNKDGFVFHDLRHTFNTNMRKAGIFESVIMEITGHSTREMFDRYNTIDKEDTRQAIEQLQVFLKNLDQSLDQVPKNEVGNKKADI
jgi:integrase